MLVRLMVRGIGDVVRHPCSLLLTVTAVAVTIFLGGLFALGLHNLDQTFARQRSQAQFQIYWRIGANQELVARQWAWMQNLPYLTNLRTFTPGQALTLMRQTLGHQGDLRWLHKNNPLPYTALLHFQLPASDPTFAQTMYARLAGMEGVAEVRFNPRQVDMAQAVGLVSRRVVWPLALMLLFLMALVVGNTVHMAFVRRRDEVDIMRLVGAREWTIRLPLIAGAAFLGLLGGLAGVGLLKTTQSAMAETLNVPPLWLHLTFLPTGTVLLGLAAATVIAAVAGALAARG